MASSPLHKKIIRQNCGCGAVSFWQYPSSLIGPVVDWGLIALPEICGGILGGRPGSAVVMVIKDELVCERAAEVHVAVCSVLGRSVPEMCAVKDLQEHRHIQGLP